MKYVLVSYNNDPSWVKQYTDDWIIFDRSEKPFDFPNTIHTKNVGNVDYDKLCWIVDNYDNLPEVFLISKTNLFKFITKEEFEKVKDNKTFTPLLTKNHKTYLPICKYDENKMYQELNNSWYVSAFKCQYETYNDWAEELGLPTPIYLTFAPGGSYIVTAQDIHKWPKEFYIKLRNMLSYTRLPAEAHFMERTYYQLWS